VNTCALHEQCILVHAVMCTLCALCSLCKVMNTSIVQPVYRFMIIQAVLCYIQTITGTAACDAQLSAAANPPNKLNAVLSKLCLPAVCSAGVPENPHPNPAASAAQLHAPLPPAQAHSLHGGESCNSLVHCKCMSIVGTTLLL